MNASPTQPEVAPAAPVAAIPLTTGEITWTEAADGKAQEIMFDYSASLRKRSEEEAQINMSSTVSAHYVDTAARQLRLLTKRRKGTAYLANLGALFAGGALSAGTGTVLAPPADITVLVISALFFAAGLCSLVLGSRSDR